MLYVRSTCSFFSRNVIPKQSMIPLLHALGFLAWGGIISYGLRQAEAFAAARAKRIPKTPLPDVLHDVLPTIHTYAPDYALLACAAATVWYGMHFTTSDVVCLFLSWSFRLAFVCLTTFPPCIRPETIADTAYSRLLMSQHDLMYSGHTCVFMFLGGALPGMLGYGVQFACPLLLLTASRQHYTIDVVVAMVVYTLIRANIA